MTLLLSSKEIHRLTGYLKPSKQIDWLKKKGIPHYVAGDGHPRIVRAHLERREIQRSTPDLEALKQLR